MTGGTDLFEILHTTRAMRRLKPDPVPDELIRKILEAAVAAASGGNTQRWRFLVVKDRSIKEQVQRYYQQAFDGSGRPALSHQRASSRLQSRPIPPPAQRGTIPDRAFPRSANLDRCMFRRRTEDTDPIVGSVNLSGGAEHVAGSPGLGARRHIDLPAPESRKGSRGHLRPASRCPLLRHTPHRLSAGEFRFRWPWLPGRCRLPGPLGSALYRSGLRPHLPATVSRQCIHTEAWRTLRTGPWRISQEAR